MFSASTNINFNLGWLLSCLLASGSLLFVLPGTPTDTIISDKPERAPFPFNWNYQRHEKFSYFLCGIEKHYIPFPQKRTSLQSLNQLCLYVVYINMQFVGFLAVSLYSENGTNILDFLLNDSFKWKINIYVLRIYFKELQLESDE